MHMMYGCSTFSDVKINQWVQVLPTPPTHYKFYPSTFHLMVLLAIEDCYLKSIILLDVSKIAILKFYHSVYIC